MKDLILSSSVKMHDSISCLRNKIIAFSEKQDGVTAIEYAVIAVAVSGMLMTVFGSGDDTFIGEVTKKFKTITDNLKK